MDIARRAVSHVVRAKYNFFGHLAAHGYLQLADVLFACVVVVLLWEEECDTRSMASRQNSSLVHGVEALSKETNECVTTFVISGMDLVLEGNGARLLLSAHGNLVLGPFHVIERDEL